MRGALALVGLDDELRVGLARRDRMTFDLRRLGLLADELAMRFAAMALPRHPVALR